MLKTKQRPLNIIASLILALYPFTFAATTVYAVPSLPSSPEAPQNPDSPDSPQLPGEEEAVLTTNSQDSGTTSEGSGYEGGSSNTDTGADSTNTAETTTDNNTEVDLNNEAEIDNLVSVDALSGGNDADKNTGDGSVNTGTAAINGSLETDANSINLGALECSTQCDTISIGSLESTNSNTGSGSENTSESNLDNNNSLDVSNSADLDNWVMFDADSGNNSASYNTGSGEVEAGDAEVILTAINTANNTNVGYQAFNVYDDQTGDVVIDFNSLGSSPYLLGDLSSSNNTTGADSTNTASSDANNNTQILIDNEGNIINNYYLEANTGNNTADKNTGNGSVTTGDANVVFNLINFLNNAFLGGGGELLLGVVNIFGSLSGDIVLQGLGSASGAPYNGGTLTSTNNTTGAYSNNDAASSVNNDTDITLANSAEVLNNLTLDATTGDNTADKNTGGGSISTGSTNTNATVTNIANNTAIGGGGTIWMVLVNNMGTWAGQLFDTGSSSGAYSPFFTFTVGPDGSLSASNQNTGADSNNEASTNVDNETDITITNTATLTNNVVIDANTGGNSASKNTGNGTIKTGDVNVAANIMNVLNNIFLGGRFALTIVNIFGSFTGNIINSDAIGAVTVNPNESIAISPNAVNSSNYSQVYPIGSFALGSSGVARESSENDENEDSALVLGTNQSDSLPTARFTADRGLLNDFKLIYLIFPVIFGVAFSLGRRALFKEVRR